MRHKTIVAVLALAVAAFVASPCRAQSGNPEWDRAVGAAEKEGTVVINMPAGNALRDFLTSEWPKAFPKITLVTNSIDEGTWIARVRIERQSGKYSGTRRCRARSRPIR